LNLVEATAKEDTHFTDQTSTITRKRTAKLQDKERASIALEMKALRQLLQQLSKDEVIQNLFDVALSASDPWRGGLRYG